VLIPQIIDGLTATSVGTARQDLSESTFVLHCFLVVHRHTLFQLTFPFGHADGVTSGIELDHDAGHGDGLAGPPLDRLISWLKTGHLG
jgi:hypothetical protein